VKNLIEKPQELVEVTVKLPRAVLEFFKAVFAFEQSDIKELDEWLGHEVTCQLEAHFNSNLESLIDQKQILKNYGLVQVEGYAFKRISEL
jgi:hypothetical protein